MLQRRPNCTVFRSMDSYIQILCRIQKCKQKVPPLSLLNNEKSPLTQRSMDKIQRQEIRATVTEGLENTLFQDGAKESIEGKV